MNKIEAKAFLKLGTAVRYLKDVKYKMADKSTDDEPLGGTYIVDNINKVLRLASDLGFVGTIETGSYKRLVTLRDELNEANKSIATITIEQSERLHNIAEDVRSSLFAEGKKIYAYYLDAKELEYATSMGWPEKITPELLKKTPFKIWKWLVGIIITMFVAGITVSETGLYSKLTGISSNQEASVESAEKTTKALGKSKNDKEASTAQKKVEE